MLQFSDLTNETAVANLCVAMDTESISKNGRSLKKRIVVFNFFSDYDKREIRLDNALSPACVYLIIFGIFETLMRLPCKKNSTCDHFLYFCAM